MPRTAIVLSDTHLGSARADPENLRDFLASLEPGATSLRLILNGDIVDLWRASDEECAEAAGPVFDAVATLIRSGGIVDWVIGNHDHHLLRALGGEGSAVLDRLPAGVRFHHPFRRLVQKDRVFLITHGDVYDFLYTSLELMGPLSWALAPEDLYGFYDWIYELDKESIAAFDRDGTRGLLLAWLAQTWRGICDTLGGRVDARAASAVSASFGLDPADLARRLATVSTDEIWQRTDAVLRWRRMRYVSPHPTRVGRRRFAGRDEIVCGHFHDPRQTLARGWAVTDDGAWWDGPGSGGTYVEISGGSSTLRRWPA